MSNFPDQIQFLRPYDRFNEGAIVDIYWGGPIDPPVAKRLCARPGPGGRPFAYAAPEVGDAG